MSNKPINFLDRDLYCEHLREFTKAAMQGLLSMASGAQRRTIPDLALDTAKQTMELLYGPMPLESQFSPQEIEDETWEYQNANQTSHMLLSLLYGFYTSRGKVDEKIEAHIAECKRLNDKFQEAIKIKIEQGKHESNSL